MTSAEPDGRPAGASATPSTAPRPAPSRRRPELAAATLLYVVPLLLTSAFLVHVGLAVLGLSLLVIEAVVALLVHQARRRPARPAVPRDGSAVLLAMGAGVLVVALVLLGVIALTS